MTTQRKWVGILSGKRKQRDERGQHTLLWRDLKKIILEKIVGNDKRSKEKNILKGIGINTKTYWDVFYTQRGEMEKAKLGELMYGEKMCTLSHLSKSQHIRPFVWGRVTVMCDHCQNSYNHNTIKNHKYFRVSQLFPCFLSTSAVAADPLSGLWGEVSTPK